MTASIQLKFYVFVILYQKLMGIAPYNYSNIKKKFVTEKFDLVYPFLIMLNYSYFYYVLLCKYSLKGPALIIKWILYGRLSTILLSWFVHCARRHSFVKFFNAAFHFNGILTKIPAEKELKIIPTLLRSGIVTLVNSALHFFAISGMVLSYQKVDKDENEGKFAIYAITLITFVIQLAVPTTFYGMTLIAKLYFKKINCITTKIMAEVASKIHHRQEKMELQYGLDDLSARLDRMCYLHSDLTNLSKLFNRIYSFQMLMVFLDYFASVLSNVYFVYLFLSTSSKESTQLVFALLSTFTSLFDVWRISHTCDGLMKEAHKTGKILHRVYLPEEMDIRFQQSMEMFSIQLIQNKLEINACRMFAIDSTLLLGILISTTTHLIIIIQFDIAGRELNLSH